MPETTRPWLDFATFERGLSTNTALACSAEMCPTAAPSRPALEFGEAPAQVAEALRRIEPSAEFKTEPSGDIRARFVAVTRVLRFRDDVDVLIRRSGAGQSVVAIYSRSRIGLSDLGANAARINRLESQLRAKLAEIAAGA